MASYASRFLAIVLFATLAACAGGSGVGVNESALVVGVDDIVGFEDKSGWSDEDHKLSLSSLRTEGQSSLAVAPTRDDVELRSALISRNAPVISALSSEGTVVAVDVLIGAGDNQGGKGRRVKDDDNDDECDGNRNLKGRQPPPPSLGNVILSVACKGFDEDDGRLGRVKLVGQRAGSFATAEFAVPAGVRRRLAQARGDCRFYLEAHAHGSGRHGYAFDNLRVRLAGQAPAGAAGSADLVATAPFLQVPGVPGAAQFPVAVVQVPASLRVKKGSAGKGKATLILDNAGVVVTTCTFLGAAQGSAYQLDRCTDGFMAGDLVAADGVRLSLDSADPQVGPTKVRAQLAINPLGDAVGAELLPPMPTFWGDNAADADAIATAFFKAVNDTSKRDRERFITAPTPEFALPQGTGEPWDNLQGPPPPNDPPFDKESHLGGGAWDGYWRLAGSLSADNSGDHTRAHFDATLSAHAVLWSKDIEIAKVTVTADSDRGKVTADKFIEPRTKGTLHSYLFGIELPGGGEVDPRLGFKASMKLKNTLSLPKIRIWIFSIGIGVTAFVDVVLEGGLAPIGFDFTLSPSAGVAAHVEGGIDVVVASGGVAADINLLSVKTPMSARGGFTVDTSPAVCGADFSYALDGKLSLGALGGEISLQATFGICPFCDHESWTIYRWPNRDLGTKTLFHYEDTVIKFAFDPSLCRLPLDVLIKAPAAGATVSSGFPAVLDGVANRAPSETTLDRFVSCGDLVWTSDDGSDIGFPATGCAPVGIIWGNAGPRVLTLTATNVYGETGSATVAITVAGAAPGLHAIIDHPFGPAETDKTMGAGAAPPAIPLAARAVGGAGGTTFSWTAESKVRGIVIPIGAGANQTFVAPDKVDTIWTISVTATDKGGATDTASVPVTLKWLK